MDKKKDFSVSKFRIRFKDEFKHQVCREFLTGHYSKSELQSKYGIKGKSRLLGWLRKLGYMEYIRENEIKVLRKNHLTKDKKHLEKASSSAEPAGLQIALDDARLEAEAYRRMIELAEGQYKIKIRKNLSTK